MRKIFVAVLALAAVAAVAGCALNPFAEDNIYKRKNAETAAMAGETKADFQKADADKNGLISKREAESVPGLAAVFDRHNPDNDGTLDWNEFTAAMKSVN